MKISPAPSVSMTTTEAQPSRVDSLRLRMTTNATPLANQILPPPVDQMQTEAPVEATQPLSPQLALLAKQKRALQVRERELQTREKALLSQSSGTTAIDVARLKAEPLSVLLENGITYDQLTEALMSNTGNSEINALKAEIESLRQGIDQKFTDKDSQAKQQVLAEMQREAEKLVRQSDDYEFVREQGKVPTVMELIDRTYEDNGEVLEVSEALRLVEEELFNEAKKIANFKKMQGQMQGRMATQYQPQQRYTGMRTLTNRDTASVPLSAKARAMAAFYGTLKR